MLLWLLHPIDVSSVSDMDSVRHSKVGKKQVPRLKECVGCEEMISILSCSCYWRQITRSSSRTHLESQWSCRSINSFSSFLYSERKLILNQGVDWIGITAKLLVAAHTARLHRVIIKSIVIVNVVRMPVVGISLLISLIKWCVDRDKLNIINSYTNTYIYHTIVYWLTKCHTKECIYK